MAGHPERTYHALIAGSVGGYFVWGQYSSVNHQITMYLTSRVFMGLSKRAWEKYSPHTYGSVLQHPKTYSILSAAMWGIVMVLFEESPHVLHPSLKRSMDEIYRYQISSFSSRSTVGDEERK
jgi:peroxisomal membrane protein 4